ncbi:MAG: cation:proton antiporter [Candidatus Saccharicenans sp.]
MRTKFDALGFGFFVPLFFLYVGVNFNFRSLVKDPRMSYLLPILLISAYLIKMIPALFYKFKSSWRETLSAGVPTSSLLTLIISAAGIGLRLGAIDEATSAAFVLVAAVTSTVSPVLTNKIMPSGQVGLRSAIGLIGATEEAFLVARELLKRREMVLFIVADPSEKDRAEQAGFSSLLVEGLPGTLQSVKLPPLKSLLVMTESDENNAALCRAAAARSLSHIVALASDPSKLSELKEPGVQIFSPGLFRTSLLALMAQNPDLFELLISTRKDHRITEIIVSNLQVSGQSLRELGLGSEILIISIRRGKDYLVPRGDTRLEIGDWLTVYGTTRQVLELKSNLE